MENPAPGLYTHAYLLLRDGGNVLFYNTGHQHEIDEIASLGGVAYQYLSHQDELGESLALIRQRFGAKLGGHIREQAEFARYLQPDILFDRRETHLGNIDVIPTPGHTPGSTCFLVTSKNDKRYLFTGDTLYRSPEGDWKAGFIPGYNNNRSLESVGQTMNLNFKWSRLESLSALQLYEIIKARESVFVVEQQCPYQETDDLDPQSWHLAVFLDGEFAAYARVVDPGRKYQQPSIGRVMTLPRFRGLGIGRKLVSEAIKFTEQNFPGLGIRIGAQVYLQKFYESFGFEVVGAPYDEDGIPHIDMFKPPHP